MTRFRFFGWISIAILLVWARSTFAQQFIETFDGAGRNTIADGRLLGFDNPGWQLDGDARFEDGGLLIESVLENGQEMTFNSLFRDISFGGDFASKLIVKEPILSISPIGGNASINLTHWFDPNRNGVGMWIRESNQDPSNWIIGIAVSQGPSETMTVPSGEHFELLMSYNTDSELTSFYYDNDVNDETDCLLIGELSTASQPESNQQSIVSVVADSGRAVASLDFWSLTSSAFPGDLNNNERLDAGDLDILSAAILDGRFDESMDFVQDGIINESDRTIWIHDLAQTWFGDSDLDGIFDSGDLVAVFQASEYEDAIELNSLWATGDWNGDREFDSRDLVFAFQDGGYEMGPRNSAEIVPEPNAVILMTTCLVPFARLRGRQMLPQNRSKR